MTLNEEQEFRRSMRRYYLITIGLVILFGAANAMGFIWNRASIDRMQDAELTRER